MKTKYVIYGYEFSTNEKGAAPEVCQYQVAEVFYGEHDNVTMLIHSDFSFWKSTTRAKVWKQVYQEQDLNEYPPDALSYLIKDFDKLSTAHWYFLSENEYNEWVEWARGDGAKEVTISKIYSKSVMDAADVHTKFTKN